MVNLNVSVPAGQIPGNTLTVVTPSGQSLTVIIPAGVAAGGTFQITVPDNMATAAAVTMAVPTEVPAPAVPVRASIDTGTPVIGRAIGQAQANSGLAPMETSVSRGPPQPTQRVKQAKEAVFCTSAVTMVFSILLIGTVGGVLGLATSWTISCCTTGHIKLAKKAKEIRALAISALAFTATGALVAVVIGGALLSDGSNCVAESPYNLGSCSTNPYNGTKDIPFNGTKGPGFVEAGGYNPNVSAYDDGCSPDYCESDLGHPDSLSSPGEPRCFVPGNEERCKCSRGEARVIGRHLIYVHHVHAYDIWYEFTCCPNDGNERENPPVVDRCGVGTTTPDGRRLESAAAADDDDDDDDDEVDARPFHEKLLSATGVIASLVQRKGEALGGDVGRRGAKALTGAWLAEALGFERFRSTPTVGPAAVAGGDAAAGASRKRRLLANDDSCKSCTHSWCHDETKNGWCQDGSYGSHSSECPCGTDLTDCGTRSAEQCGFDSFEHVKNDNSCEPPYAAIGGYSQLYSAHPKARPKTGCDVGTHGCGPGWGRRMDDGDGGGGDDEDGFPACYSGPACAGIAHGCYDCSILKESDCDGQFEAHLTDLSKCAEGSEPKVAACYRGPACTAAGASHGCYDCSVTKASECASSFNDALSINSCLEGTAPTKPAGTNPPAPPAAPPNPPSPPPPQRMEDCKPGDGIKCGGNDVCGGVLLEKPKAPPNPTLEPCYSHAQCRKLDGSPGRGVCCVPVGTCDHLGSATSGYEGRPIVSGAMKYYVGGCEPYAHGSPPPSPARSFSSLPPSPTPRTPLSPPPPPPLQVYQ